MTVGTTVVQVREMAGWPARIALVFAILILISLAPSGMQAQTLSGITGTVTDPSGAWDAVSGIGSDGAVLVRPDQHVAWRAVGVPADPAAGLRDALDALFGS